jgi:starch synthase (maltosyl-transferring)
VPPPDVVDQVEPTGAADPSAAAAPGSPSGGSLRPTGPRSRRPEQPRTAAGRIPVLDVTPMVDGGRWPARAVVGEAVPVSATVLREGHDAVGVTAVLRRPDGTEHERRRMVLVGPGLDRYTTHVTPDARGSWTITVEGWSDPYATWRHAAEIKVPAGIDVELVLAEGAEVLRRAVAALPLEAPGGSRSGTAPGQSPAGTVGHTDGGDRHTVRPEAARRILSDAILALRDETADPHVRLAIAIDDDVRRTLDDHPLRELVTEGPVAAVRVERERALFSAWYELFPRSEGAYWDQAAGRWVSGTFRTAAARLPGVSAMGFDVVYLPPIHPIGRVNRKGPNNSLTAGPGDPGSPWAIGAEEGGHDAIHPDLGDEADFAAFVSAARDAGLEVALDLALNCAPDHPWAREHPEWFTLRVDGSIAYSENPPKKYQDIYPLNFDVDPAGLYTEVLRVVRLWIDRGVTLFRVDNPHTKPVEFWEWLIATVNAEHPDVIFLAEAFTRPAMMATLAKAGFQQSYTYFTWRTTKQELTEYLTELSGVRADYMRPNFWPNTPDILHAFLQYGGPAAFRLRAVLAATTVPSWGMYAGYELYEHVARPGAEEYLDNEKYQYRPRDWEAAERDGRSLAPFVARLNAIRRAHPALQRLRNIVFHPTTDDSVIAYTRHLPADQSSSRSADTVLVVVNLDPHATHEAVVDVDPVLLGLASDASYTVRDLLTDQTWTWGRSNFVRLDPFVEPAHVFHVQG